MCNSFNKKSFTLVEVLISVSILSFGLAVLLQGNVRLLNIIRISENNLSAISEAEIKMAEFEIKVKEEPKKIFSEKVSETFERNNKFFVWEVDFLDVQVKEGDKEVKSKLKEVRTEMLWEEGKRKGRVFLYTFMREPVDKINEY